MTLYIIYVIITITFNKLNHLLTLLGKYMGNITYPQLLNISEAAEYLGTTHDWINFLKDNSLIIPIFLPQYTKPRFQKSSLDDFIQRLSNFNYCNDDDKLLQQAFTKAAKKRKCKYEKFQK